MKTRLPAIVAALAVAACALMYFDRSADGQQAPIPAGRFQIVISEFQGNGQLFVFEPNTGRCWSRSSASHVKDEWHDLGSPVIKDKR